MLAAGGRQYQVGGFVIDTARYRISSGDTAVPVEPKVFDLLVCLIRNRDRVLTREELFQAVWDGREVSDATLSNHVKIARKALGDSGELQQTIQTIRGRGYQFIAPVSEVSEDTVGPGQVRAPVPPAGNPDEPRRRIWRRPLPLAIIALLVPMALFGSRFLMAPAVEPESGRPHILVVPFGVSDNATEYHRTFADQLTREVIDNMRKISGLRMPCVRCSLTSSRLRNCCQ
jgi:DNA-binding winged helix-turn-helix (wHTH) protein